MARLSKSFALLLALAVLAIWSSPSWAAAETPTRGMIQSVNADQHQLVITDKDGKNWTFRVMENAPVFVPNENNAKLGELKTGEDVSLLWQKDNNGKFMTSAILLHQGDFKNARLEAATMKNVGTDKKEFTARDARGKEWTYHLGNNARFRLAGKDSKLSDFRADSHVAIVWEKSGDQYRVLAMCDDPARNR